MRRLLVSNGRPRMSRRYCCVCGSRPDRGGLCVSRAGLRGRRRPRHAGRFPGTSHHAAQPPRRSCRRLRAPSRGLLSRRASGMASEATPLARTASARCATRSRRLRTATPPPIRCARSGGSRGGITAPITRAGTSRPRSATIPAISAGHTIRAKRSRSTARRRSTTSPPIRRRARMAPGDRARHRAGRREPRRLPRRDA